jgi:hypothetical protein
MVARVPREDSMAIKNRMDHSVWFGAVLACAALLASWWPLQAAAAPPVNVRYQITTSVGPIGSVVLYTRYEDPGSGPFDDHWPFGLPAGGGTLNDPRAHDLSFVPRAALLLGVLEAGGGAPARGVVMMDAAVADAIVAKGWGFADTFGIWSGATGSFVGDLQSAASLTYPARNAATDALNQFASENARFSAAGNSWFELAVAKPGTTTVTGFKLVAFSTGEIVGEGSAFVTAVPEPASWALMLGGMTMVAAWAWRRV